MSFLKNVSYTFVTKVGLLITGLVTSIVIARMLGAEGKGMLSLAVLSASVIYSLTNLGLGSGSGYFLGRKKIDKTLLAGIWMSLSLLIGGLAMSVSLIPAPIAVPRILPDVPVGLVMIALCSIPFSIILYNFQMLSRADADFRAFNILELSQPGIFLLVFLSLVWFFPDSKLTVAVATFSFSVFAAAMLALFIWGRKVKLRPRWDGGIVKSAMGFGVMGHMTSFLGFLNLRVDMLLLNFFISVEAVGYYSISVMIAEKIWYFPDTLAIVLYPRVAHGSDEEANIQTSIVSRQVVLIVTAVCIVLAAVARPLIDLLYSDLFSSAFAPFLFLLPGVLSASLSRVLGSDLMARGHPKVNMWAGFAALITNVGCNMIFIPKFGIIGAAGATSISYTLHFLVILWAFVRISGLPVSAILVPGREDLMRFPEAVTRLIKMARDGRTVEK
ncbi:MAG: polysaccharide biosynthesis C-terminal domain-containing protein [Candidatus Krumholzibacteria bacterium]|nr:polysaccharide biosynthesis C-terminal domain-containing protein [Candidatus Krumholzibacteria bacterium]